MGIPTILLAAAVTLAVCLGLGWLGSKLGSRFLVPRLARFSFAARLVLMVLVYVPTLFWFMSVCSTSPVPPSVSTVVQLIIGLVLVGVCSTIPQSGKADK